MRESTIIWVRKHRAPKGALRQLDSHARRVPFEHVRKHRAPKGALRHRACGFRCVDNRIRVRKHRAPNGALRPDSLLPVRRFVTLVRKHRAPNGALRLALGIVVEVHGRAVPESTERQTVHLDWFPHDTATCGVEVSQKAPSAKRCIKTREFRTEVVRVLHGSESTEHQKVH